MGVGVVASENAGYVAFYEAAGRVKSFGRSELVSSMLIRGDGCWSGLRSREVPSSFYSRSSGGKRLSSPAQEGIRGWGRHLAGGTRPAAKATFALTHPSNLRETGALTLGPLGHAGSARAARGCRERPGANTLPSRRSA